MNRIRTIDLLKQADEAYHNKKLLSKVAVGTTSRTCWLWTASTNSDGYGKLYHKRKLSLAHRLVLEIKLGRKIKAGYCSLHTCDNPSCVNPNHLFEGTQLDNMRDCLIKQRAATRAGVHNGRAKLLVPDILQIRRLSSKGVKQRCIAKMFKLSREYVSLIVHRKRWECVA